MNDLHIHHDLPPTVIDDQDSHTASTLSKCTLNPSEQSSLINHRQSLLDIARLRHRNNQSILPDVQDAVLLEHRSQHRLDNHTWRWVADETALLMQLPREEVDTEVSVLTCLAAHADTNDLRRSALEQQDVPNADEMALDGHALAAEPWLHVADLLDRAITHTHWPCTTGAAVALGNHHFVSLDSVAMVAVREWVQDAVCSTLDAAAERVVLSFIVVVTHLVSCLGCDLFLLDGDVCVCLQGPTTLVFNVVIWIEAAAVVSFGDVELCLKSAAVVCLVLVAVDVDFDVVSSVAAVDV